MQNIVYRKCRKKDLLPACRLMRTAIKRLRADSGLTYERWRIGSEPPPLMVNFHNTDNDTMYCAWKKDKLVGFAGAYVRGKQWYLAWLFVHPAVQDKGIGKKLLSKVWRERRGMTHSLCTFAFNPQAIGLYSKFGMAPLCDLPWMKAYPDDVNGLKPTGLKVIDTHTRDDIRWLHGLEEKIRGYSHPQHWESWLKGKQFKIYILKNRGRRVGYFMIVNKTWIAPVGVVSEKYIIDAVTEAVRLTDPDKDNKIALWCPSLNLKLYQHLIKIGFRVSELELFMSDTPYPDWSRYVPATLAVL